MQNRERRGEDLERANNNPKDEKLSMQQQSNKSKLSERSHDLLEIMLTYATESIIIYDPRGKCFIDFNDNACLVLGYSREEFSKLKIEDIEANHSSDVISNNVGTVANGETIQFESQYKHKNGELLDISIVLTPIISHDRALVCVVWRDISAAVRREAEHKKIAENYKQKVRVLQTLQNKTSLIQGDIKAFSAEATELIGSSLDYNTVSFWEHDESMKLLSCIHCYDERNGGPSARKLLSSQEYTEVLNQLVKHSFIILSTEAADPVSDTFIKEFLEPASIPSLLLSAVLYRGSFLGMVGFSKPNAAYIWSYDEISCCLQIANLFSMAYLNRERIEAIDELQKSEYRLKQAQSVAKMGHWFIDIRQKSLSLSEESRSILGYSTDSDITIKNAFARLHKDDTVIKKMLSTLSTNILLNKISSIKDIEDFVPNVINCRIATHGKPKWVAIKWEFDFNEDNPISAMGTIQDITENVDLLDELLEYRHQLESMVIQRTAELEAAKLAAEKANRAKSVFLSNVSHEIRTPMNAVIGYASLLKKEPLSPCHKEQLSELISAADNLLDVIDEVLDISKIEAGKVILEEHTFNPESILKNAVDMVSEVAKVKKLELSVSTWDLPEAIIGDGSKLKQVLINLLSNAVKFTEKGFVHINAYKLADNGNNVTLRFEVKDTGIGMTNEQLARLFKDYEQTSDTINRLYGGSGLGLSISKKLLDLMGGFIGVESEPGSGCFFWIEIPYKAAMTDEAPIASEFSSHSDNGGDNKRAIRKGTRILIAEDNKINQELMRHIMDSFGLDISIAIDGQVAVDLARAGSYDLILMDIQMPVIDGLQATTIIRRLPGYESVPIVALTASAFTQDRQNSLDSGMNDYITKPVTLKKLSETFLKWLPSTSLPKKENIDSPVIDSADIISYLKRIDGLDVSTGLQILGGNTHLYIRLLDLYLEDHSLDVELILSAAAVDDFDKIFRISHTLNGVSGNLGLDRIQKIAAEVERVSKAGVHTEEFNSLCVSLRKEIARFKTLTANVLPLESFHSKENNGFNNMMLPKYTVLENLEALLLAHDAEANEMAESIQNHLETAYSDLGKVMIKQIRIFNYSKALETLQTIMKKETQ